MANSRPFFFNFEQAQIFQGAFSHNNLTFRFMVMVWPSSTIYKIRAYEGE